MFFKKLSWNFSFSFHNRIRIISYSVGCVIWKEFWETEGWLVLSIAGNPVTVVVIMCFTILSAPDSGIGFNLVCFWTQIVSFFKLRCYMLFIFPNLVLLWFLIFIFHGDIYISIFVSPFFPPHFHQSRVGILWPILCIHAKMCALVVHLIHWADCLKNYLC